MNGFQVTERTQLSDGWLDGQTAGQTDNRGKNNMSPLLTAGDIITIKELTIRPLFFSDNNISSISTFMQNMKRFLKLFSKIRSRDKTAYQYLQ